MQQEQVQVEKTFSFEEICPEISILIAQDENGFMGMRKNTYKAEDGTTRTIMKYDSCLVSEAHNG